MDSPIIAVVSNPSWVQWQTGYAKAYRSYGERGRCS